ncbi:MAG TPA: hypothetical protein VHK65_03825 [Candidatus Dormibacteraeota bacterium]|nr:hypothetical protein [Candidatus Dormibacteraeota bacterium]
MTLVIAAPWLLPGFLFGTDWPGPRHFSVPGTLSNDAPLLALLALAAHIVPAEIVGKLLIAGTLLVAAQGAYRAMPGDGFIPRAVASLVYTVNPFVYGRLHYGQLFLLAAYAILPWLALWVRHFLAAPTPVRGLFVAAWLVLIGALDLHLFLAAFVLCGVMGIVYGISKATDHGYLAQLGLGSLVASAAAGLGSAYWLIPFVSGSSPEASTVAGIGASDIRVYQAVGDPHLGLIPNLLGLYGFWAENIGRFPSFKLFAPLWPIVLVALLMIALVGSLWVLLARHEDSQRDLRPWVMGLLIAGAIALVLDVGAADSRVAVLVTWLDRAFPPYRGMRDSGKWAAILALVYAQLVPLGVIAVTASVKTRLPSGRLRDLAQALVTGLALALPLYYGNGLLFGMHGQLRPSQYPSGWYQADRLLLADPHPGRALFLPWHQYLAISFVDNTNKVVASPAPSFFSIPVVISPNPEIPGIAAPGDPDQIAISGLVTAARAGDWAPILAKHNIKYVLVAREVDWRGYSYLAEERGLELVADYGSVVVYRDLLWTTY